MICPECGVDFIRLTRHIREMHGELHAQQSNLVLELYRGGATFGQIAANPLVLYKDKMSVLRIVKTGVAQADISSNRKSRIRRTKKAAHEASVARRLIDCGDARAAVVPLIRDLSKSHVPDLLQATPNTVIIYSDELSKAGLINSMLRARAGLVSRKIGARKCSVVSLSTAEARSFFNENHISGHVRGCLYLGLRYAGELVAAISMRRPFTKKYPQHIEIARFAVLRNLVVPGGFTKLLSAVESRVRGSYTHILSYCDLRYGVGKVYLQAGFTQVGVTGQDYFYTDGQQRWNRFKFRAAGGATEREVADAAGVWPMYGAGSLIFVKAL